MEKSVINQDVAEKSKNRYFSTVNLVIFAILAVLGNVVSNFGLDFLKNVIPKAPVPFLQLLSGHHLIWMALAFGLTKKHGAPTFTASIKGIMEFMLGDAYFGPWVILLNIVEGGMLDVGFYLMKRFNYQKIKWIIAGAIGNVFQPLATYSLIHLYVGKPFIAYEILIIATIMAVISGIFITGLLGHEIAKILNREDVRAYMHAK